MKIEWVPIENLRPNPKNPNKHPDDQIERLARVISYQGFRLPIVVSNQTGLIMAGHGRLLAAMKLGLKEVPVSKQDFVTEEQAYAFMVSDNAIASWSDLDLSQIDLEVQNLGPDFDMDMLGMHDFHVDMADKNPKDKMCPNCGAALNSGK